jgi:glycine/D-amino acid oxidase-like deaminating enzyme/nitrite reductase/ring-hydroxylating ferredoxin subunit
MMPGRAAARVDDSGIEPAISLKRRSGLGARPAPGTPRHRPRLRIPGIGSFTQERIFRAERVRRLHPIDDPTERLRAMNPTDSGATTSLWHLETPRLVREPLPGDTTADVCVVGAGIAGLSVAYELSRAGQSVIVVEDGEVGGGATLLTTAHLASGLDDRYHRLEYLHGERGAELAAASHAAAIDRIERILADERIACDFARVPGFLVLGEGCRDELDEEFDAARRAGLEVRLHDRFAPNGHDFGRALEFTQQGQFHPGKYLAGLLAAVERRGGRVHCGTHADAIEGGANATVRTARGTISCGAVVVATNTPVNDRLVMHTKQAPYRTYVVAGHVPTESIEPLLLWDTEDPYHYVRTQPGDAHDWLIVGGEDHKVGQDDEAQARFDALLAWAKARFPKLTHATVRWSGQILEPHDALAFIGRNPMDDDNVYVATGDSGNGMTHGTIAGMLIRDLVLGQANPWSELYDPARKSLRAAKDFLRENLNFAAQYRDFVTPGDVDEIAAIARNDGAIVRRGLRKIAVYRDSQGGLHAHSAVCPHLGCAVRWNDVERTFDCPCHGSRFAAADGHVINGPANAGLAPLELDAEGHVERKLDRPGESTRA